MTLWSATYELVKQPPKEGWIMAVISLGILAIVTAIQFIVSFTIFGNLTVAGNMLLQGNLGIGTDDPQAKLHVVGDILFEGNLTLKGTQIIKREDIMNSEQLLITNDGTGPALVINQKGEEDIVEIQDDGVPVLKIYDGASSSGVRMAVAGPIRAQTYISTSDYRVKENISEIEDSLERVKKLNPKRYTFKGSPDVMHEGFLAHELQEILPCAVIGKKDQVDSNGDPIYQGVDYAKLVPLLADSLQKCILRIEQLEERLNHL